MTRLDAYPENINHRDTGCRLAPRCLSCPYPICFHDSPASFAKAALALRDRAALALISTGATTGQAASHLHISRRTLFRHLHRARRRLATGPAPPGGPPSPSRGRRLPPLAQ